MTGVNEPPHDKTNKVACAPSEDSDQPGHPPSLIRVFVVRMKKAWDLSYPSSAQRRLIRLDGCPGWSESSLGAQSFCWFWHMAGVLNGCAMGMKLTWHIYFDLDQGKVNGKRVLFIWFFKKTQDNTWKNVKCRCIVWKTGEGVYTPTHKDKVSLWTPIRMHFEADWQLDNGTEKGLWDWRTVWTAPGKWL